MSIINVGSGSGSGGGSGGGATSTPLVCLGPQYTWTAVASQGSFLYNTVLREFSVGSNDPPAAGQTDRVEPIFTAFGPTSIAAFSGFVFIANASTGGNTFKIRAIKNNATLFDGPSMPYTPGSRTGFRQTFSVGANTLADGDKLMFTLLLPNLNPGAVLYSVLYPFVYIGA